MDFIDHVTRKCKRAGITVHHRVLLHDHTTFRIGGPAMLLVEARSTEEAATAVRAAGEAGAPVRCLGGGSNVLASDEGYPGVVLGNRIAEIRFDGETVTAGGGVPWDDFVRETVDRGYAGTAAMSGIPGTVGGAIYGNAGAYGQSVSDALIDVTLVDTSGVPRTLGRRELGFAYRESTLKRTGGVVTEARFRLSPGKVSELTAAREQILATRRRKHPSASEGTAGSFFKNIEDAAERERLTELLDLPRNDHRIAAGLLLDKVGVRGMRVGDAMVFDKHANIIVNAGRATARDVLTLAVRMKARVHDAFGIALEREVVWLGAHEPEDA